MVDYALCLEEDCTQPTFTRILSAMELETPDSQYINQTSFEPVRYRPIVVSIETKVAGNENEATTQLSIWAVAHFKRLQKLMQRSGVVSEMPVLPLINVQGDEWFTRLAVQRGNETVLSNLLYFCTWLIDSRYFTAEPKSDPPPRLLVCTKFLLP